VSSGCDRARHRLAGRRRRRRLLPAPPLGRGAATAGAHVIFDPPSCGRGCLRAGDRGGRERTGADARLPARCATSATCGSSRPYRRLCRPGRLGRGRSRRCGLLERARRRLVHRPRGQQREWVEVAVRIRGQADAEVDVRLIPFGLTARADRGHDVAFLDRGAGRHADRADVHERDRVAVRSANRHAEPFVRHLAGEGDDAGRGRAEVGARRASDVDPAMLAPGVRIVVGRERSQNRSVDWPRPPGRRGAEDEREQNPDRQHRDSVAQFDNHAGAHCIGRLGCCQI
jgi:hypothetical protein